MAICKLCNHENPDGMQFCANCGNVLDVSSASAASTSEAGAGTASEAASSASDKKDEILTPQTQAPQTQPYVASQGPNSQYYEPANTVPFNAKDQAAYQQQLLRGNKPDYENVCVLALVFGILGFFLNPLYLVSVAAIVLGIIGHANNGSKKTLGMVGWILGASSLAVQLLFDFICAATTCGIGSIAICF
ncbi:MAG: hypothetical protein J5750_05895 [Clostridiales bacterium]|nr:hypothetical protein [Clostridiales bacterium]